MTSEQKIIKTKVGVRRRRSSWATWRARAGSWAAVATASKGAVRDAFDFNGQVTLVTGAAAGIGFAIAVAFRAAGARVAIGDVREPALTEAAGRLGQDGLFVRPLDVRGENSIDGFVEAAERALGPITIAVANAGIYPNTPVLDMDVTEWDRVMETNVCGVFLTGRAAGRAMAARALVSSLGQVQ